MVNINTFKLFCEFLQNKVQEGASVTVPQFNSAANRAQMQLYERDYQTFLKTKEVSEFLKVFLSNTVFTVPVNGEHSYPSDYQHLTSLRKYYVNAKNVGRMIEIEEISNVEWGFSQISQLQEPTLRFPKYNEYSSVIRFIPRNIGTVEVDYFKTPVEPLWAFTIVNGRPVYDPVNSVNFEWFSYNFNEIAGIYLSLIGINLREGDLLNWSNQYKQENNSTL